MHPALIPAPPIELLILISYFLILPLNDPRTYNECSSSNCALHDSAGISTSTTQPPS